MSLIRFDREDDRSPSAALWRGFVDWVSGSLASNLGQRDYDDYAPYNSGLHDTVTGSTGAAVAHETDRFGRLKISATAGTDAQVGLRRKIFFDLGASSVTVLEARVEQNADANSPQAFVGLFDGDADDVFAAGVIATGGNQDAIGVLWNADETFDIVAVDDGTKTVLKDDIGVTVERTSGAANIGLRIEKVTSDTYRVTPCINGAIARSGAVNVEATKLPENVMRPVVATTVAATTAPSIDIDWQFTADK